MSSAGANLPERKAAKKLGRCWVTIFRRQGLGEASELLRDGSGTPNRQRRVEPEKRRDFVAPQTTTQGGS